MGGNHRPPFEREVPFEQFRFDFAWPALMVAVEIQGGTRMAGKGHVSPKGIQRDLRKIRAAQLAGWLVLPYSDLDLRGEGVINVVLEIEGVLYWREQTHVGSTNQRTAAGGDGLT